VGLGDRTTPGTVVAAWLAAGRLNRISRYLERLKRRVTICNEALTLFVPFGRPTHLFA